MTGDWNRLVEFLRVSLGTPEIELAAEPQRVTGGFGRRSWRLDIVSPTWSQRRSLQLRCAEAWQRSLRREVDCLRWLVARGFPVSPPLLWVEDVDVVGEPFAVLEWIPGRTLAEQIYANGWRPGGIDGQTIGRLLARLHALPHEDFPSGPTPGPWAPPLEAIAGLLGHDRLDALRSWLGKHEPQHPSLAVCHLDLHPRNVVLTEKGSVVIDWEMARLNDPRMDIAMSQVHTEVALGIGEYPPRGDRFDYGRDVVDGYRIVRPVPEGDLGYFRVLAACRRLGDVAGALARPGLEADGHAELTAEGGSAIGVIDREISATA